MSTCIRLLIRPSSTQRSFYPTPTSKGYKDEGESPSPMVRLARLSTTRPYTQMMSPTMNSVIFPLNLLTNNSNNSNRNNSSSQWTRASLWLASLVCSHSRYMVWLCNRNFCTALSILLRAPRWRNPNPTYIYKLPRSPQARFLVNMGHLGNQQVHYHHITIYRARFPPQLILRLRTQNISR